ncbi:MAG: hypothetical protein PVH31_09120 [Ectothiorhodospiraceae bacterium]|jgi:hypothetical protein
MQRPPRPDRLLALFSLGVLLFNYPLLSLIGEGMPDGGLPVLWVGLFLLWAGFIFLTAFLHRPPRRGEGDD